MDALSAGASVFAVVSLAMQLADACRCLVNILVAIVNAPNEFVRLKHLVGLVGTTAAAIQDALEYQCQLHPGAILRANAVYETLDTCLQKVSKMRAVLDRFTRLEHSPSIVSRSWARVELSMKKDDVAEMEGQLGTALQMLNVSLTTNSMVAHMQSTGLVVDRIETLTYDIRQAAALPASQTPRNMPNSLQEGQERLMSITACRNRERGDRGTAGKVMSISQTTYLARPGSVQLKIRRKTERRRRGDPSHSENDHTSTYYRISTSLLPWSVEFMISRSNQTALRFGLKVDYIVPFATYEAEFRIIFLHDDVKRLQKLLSHGKICITSSVAGWTLLSRAMVWRSSNVASFLYEQNGIVDPQTAFFTLERSFRNCCSEASVSTHFNSICGRLDLTECDPYDIIPTANQELGQISGGIIVSAIESLFLFGLPQTIIPTDHFLGSLLCLLCQWWLNAETVHERRNNLARKLISSGAGIHYVDRHQRTPLQNLIWNSFYGKEKVMISEWLDVLRACDVNLTYYLQEESRFCTSEVELATHHLDIRIYDCIRPRSIVFSPSAHYGPGLTTEAWLDPGSPALLVLGEFNFCPDVVIRPGYGCSRLEPLLEVWRTGDGGQHLKGRGSIFSQLEKLRREKRCKLGGMVGDSEDADANISNIRTPRGDFNSEIFSLDSGRVKAETRWIREPTDICNCDIYGHYIDLWPFHGATHTLCQSGNIIAGATRKPCVVTPGSPWCEFHSCRFNHDRFARKQAKKSGKLTRVWGTMPGAWVE